MLTIFSYCQKTVFFKKFSNRFYFSYITVNLIWSGDNELFKNKSCKLANGVE